jgi:hypothetical protein
MINAEYNDYKISSICMVALEKSDVEVSGNF